MFNIIKKILLKLVEMQTEIISEKINKYKSEIVNADEERIKILETEIALQQNSLEFLFKLWIAFAI